MKVKPVAVEKSYLRDVRPGEIFTYKGKRYIKLAEDYNLNGTPSLSLHPINTINIVEHLETSVEQKVIVAYFATIGRPDDICLVGFQIPDADDYRAFHRQIDPHIHDAWYLDNGKQDVLKSGEFMFVDSENNLCQGVPSDINIINKVQNLNIRTIAFIEPFAEVFVSAC